MPEIFHNSSLKNYNTFGFDVLAKHLCIVDSVEDFLSLQQDSVYRENKHLFIGGGSNVLLRANFDGLVIINRIMGVEINKISTGEIIVKAGAGENWHDFVLKTIDAGLGGLENLSLIPGTVGAAPMQNIGAYGVEIKDHFHSLEAVNLDNGIIESFDAEACQFGYRESVFKHKLKGKFLITSVNFSLNDSSTHQVSTQYGAIQAQLQEMGVKDPGIKDVSNAVISIRRSKLPDPAKIGNSGSFFKNPIVSKDLYCRLKASFDEMPAYPLDGDQYKLAAGWLIEKAGWKGYQENGVGVHGKQALVLVNLGTGSGAEIEALANKIQFSVQEKFQVMLEPEVNFV